MVIITLLPELEQAVAEQAQRSLKTGELREEER